MLFQFYEQFDEDEIGALDNAELEGFIEPDSARLEEIIKDYFIQKEKEWVDFSCLPSSVISDESCFRSFFFIDKMLF